MDILNLGEFIELLSRDEEITQDEKKSEQEFDNEVEFTRALNELIDKVRKSADEDFFKCDKARKRAFLEHGENYHSFIEARIKRPLSVEETTVADIAFELAFINGWVAHKKYGGSDDK